MLVMSREIHTDNSFVCVVGWTETKNPGKLAIRRPDLPEHVPFEVLGAYKPDGTVKLRVWVFRDTESHS